MELHHSINYIEMPVRDISIAKAFFSKVFGWEYVDYGPDYASFTNAGIAGGFFVSEQVFTLLQGTPLIVLYSNDRCFSR